MHRTIGFYDFRDIHTNVRYSTMSFMRRILPNVGFDLKLFWFNVHYALKNKESLTVGDFIDLFNQMIAKAPSYTVWHGKRAPVLLLDEVQELQRLDSDKLPPDNPAALDAFLRWCVSSTKQQSKLQIIMLCNDVSFLRWLQDRIGDRVSTHVIGDLHKEAARLFFDKAVQDFVKCTCAAELAKLDFDRDVYPITGGHISYIYRFVRDVGITGSSKTILDYINKYRDIFENAVDGNYAFSGAKFAPKWKREDVTKIFTMLREQTGVSYADCKEKVGYEVIKSMIEHRLIHFRPHRPITDDLEINYPKYDERIILAPSPLHQYVLRNVSQFKSA